MSLPILTGSRLTGLRRQSLAVVSAVPIGLTGAVAVTATPAFADFGSTMTVTDTPDPVLVGRTYTYTLTATAPTDCDNGDGNCDVQTDTQVDLRHDSVQAVITAASGTSANGPGSCNILFYPGSGCAGICTFGVFPTARRCR